MWRELGLGEGPQLLLQFTEENGIDMVMGGEMGFGTGVASLLSTGDLAIRFVEEIVELLPRIMVSAYLLSRKVGYYVLVDRMWHSIAGCEKHLILLLGGWRKDRRGVCRRE